MNNTVICALGLLVAPSVQAFHINLVEDNSNGLFTTEARDGFRQAASLWEQVIATDVTINLGVTMVSLSSGAIGETDTNTVGIGYADFRSLYQASASSFVSRQVANSLIPGTLTPRYLYNNTTDLTPSLGMGKVEGAAVFVAITRSNLKALGYDSGGVLDASISFSTNYAFDYNRSDGIAVNQVDFVGVAAHEIGHALGFVSMVDLLDSGQLTSAEFGPAVLDLIRYSQASAAQGLLDLSVGVEEKYLQIGNQQFAVSTGEQNGNGYQASHFLPGTNLLRPAVATGEQIDLTEIDLAVFDALGWSLKVVPEPAHYGAFLGLVALVAACVRRRLVRPVTTRATSA